jgi:predicted amidophosphoribosyltransferase
MDSVSPPNCASCNTPGQIFCSSCVEKAKLIGPKVCLSCGHPNKNRIPICKELIDHPQLYSGMISWAHHESSVRNSIHRLKYRNNLALGYFFAMKLLPKVIEASWPIDLITPVPLSKSHYKNRGYNQAVLISRPLARGLGVRHETKALQRIRET